MSKYGYRQLLGIIRSAKASIQMAELRIANAAELHSKIGDKAASMWWCVHHPKYGFMNDSGHIICNPAKAKLFVAEFQESDALRELQAPALVRTHAMFSTMTFALTLECMQGAKSIAEAKETIRYAKFGIFSHVMRDLFTIACVACATFYMYKMS